MRALAGCRRSITAGRSQTFRRISSETATRMAIATKKSPPVHQSMAAGLQRCISPGSSILLVLDEGAIGASGAFFSTIVAAMQAAGEHGRISLFTEFSPNPKCEEADHAVEIIRQACVDCVVAVGGGSAMDVAKVAALAAACPPAVQAAVARGQPASGGVTPLPLLACPTTSGTGSEATQFAAIYDAGRKRSVEHPGLLPAAVVLDPLLKASMPPGVAAVTGLDALAHCMEARWASGASAEGVQYAREGGQAVLAGLPDALDEARRRAGQEEGAITGDAESSPDAQLLHGVSNARRRGVGGTPSGWGQEWAAVAPVAPVTPGLQAVDRVSRAAYMAGRAIAECKTTAGHALSYQLTQRYGVPHGLAVCLTLGHVARANAEVAAAIARGDRPEEDCNHPGGAEAVLEAVREACSWLGPQGVEAISPTDAPLAMQGLLQLMGLPASLSAAGVPRSDLSALAEAVDPVRLGNNPVRLSTDELEAVYSAAF